MKKTTEPTWVKERCVACNKVSNDTRTVCSACGGALRKQEPLESTKKPVVRDSKNLLMGATFKGANDKRKDKKVA